MSEQDTDILQVLVSQMRECRGFNPVIGKALCLLPETELLKPVSDLLHRGSAPEPGLPQNASTGSPGAVRARIGLVFAAPGRARDLLWSNVVSSRHHLIDPIRPTRGHIAISLHGGLYAMSSLCGSA
jgi:hypothetical protein